LWEMIAGFVPLFPACSYNEPSTALIRVHLSLFGPRGLALAHLGGITEIEMRALAIAVMITSLAVPAFAQGDPAKAEATKAEERKKKEAEELEKTYKDTLKKTTREQPAKKTDPWGSVR
jgi:hypothetical protein